MKNIIRWLPIIWKDRDWDQWFIFTILQTKLKHQAEYISKHDRHTMAQYDAQRMMTCVRLIDKIIHQDYDCEHLDYFDLDFGSTKIPGTDLYEMDVTTTWEKLDDYFLKYPLTYKRVVVGKMGWIDIESAKDSLSKRKLIASNMAHLRQAKAQRLLFQILDRHIQGWWD